MGYYYDDVGRRRKLSHGAIIRIQQRYSDGEQVRVLAQEYGVSESLIRMTTYSTARNRDLPKMQEARHDDA